MNIVSRSEWRARPPKSVTRIDTPSRELWLHHTADSSRGPSGMRAIQNFHMDVRGWSDIAYSFVIDPSDLTVYEARGAGVAGAHTRGRNTVSHAICVMGNFDGYTVSDRLVERIAELVAYGHGKGWWPPKLSGGHRDVGTTSCPGSRLYARIPDINRLAQEDDMPTPEEIAEAVWARKPGGDSYKDWRRDSYIQHTHRMVARLLDAVESQANGDTSDVRAIAEEVRRELESGEFVWRPSPD